MATPDTLYETLSRCPITGSTAHSLYSPHSYTADKHPNYPVYDYDSTNFNSTESPAYQLSFLISVKEYFKDIGIDYVIVFMPVNPDECRVCY